MKNAIIGLCTLELHLPGMSSLKDKRSIIKSMLKRLHNPFNVSAAEIDYLDKWQMSGIAITSVSNSSTHANQVLQKAIEFIETNYPEALIVEQQIEII
jgi:uncharacterized protein YlxP (DUF503 family)